MWTSELLQCPWPLTSVCARALEWKIQLNGTCNYSPLHSTGGSEEGQDWELGKVCSHTQGHRWKWKHQHSEDVLISALWPFMCSKLVIFRLQSSLSVLYSTCVCVRGQLMNRTFAAPVSCPYSFLSVPQEEQSVLRISGLTPPHKIKSSVMNKRNTLLSLKGEVKFTLKYTAKVRGLKSITQPHLKEYWHCYYLSAIISRAVVWYSHVFL